MSLSDASTKTEFSNYRSLFILAASGFVTSFGAHSVATNLPAYAQAIGVGAFTIGLLIAVYDFAELFAKPAAGFIADRRGMKQTLLAGLAIFILSSMLFLIINPRWLLLVRFAQGLGAAALSTVSIALVARYFSQGRGQAFGIYNAVKGAGYVIAPVVGGFLVNRYGFAAIFAVSAGIGFAVLVASLTLPDDRPAGERLEDEEEFSLKQFLEVFQAPHLLPVYGVIVINMFLIGVLFGFLPVYLYGIGYTPVASGALVSLATLSYLLVQPLAGRWADRFGSGRTVVGGLSMASLAILVMTFFSGFALLLAIVCAGLGVGTVWTNSDVLASKLIDQKRLGAGLGAAQSFKELGDMAGPLLIGLLIQWFGVQAGFVICGLLALTSLFALSRSVAFRAIRVE